MLHLRDGQIEFLLRGLLNRGRVVKRYFAAIGRRIAVVLFDRRPRWIGGRTCLYEVIRDGGVNCVRRPPFRHMARSAILRDRMAARRHEPLNSRLMAALAGFGVAAQRGRSVRWLVRVMATHAGERSSTLHGTGRLAQPLGGAGEFKPVFALALVRRRASQQAVALRIGRLLTRTVLYRARRAIKLYRARRAIKLYRARRAVEMQNVIFQ